MNNQRLPIFSLAAREVWKWVLYSWWLLKPFPVYYRYYIPVVLQRGGGRINHISEDLYLPFRYFFPFVSLNENITRGRDSTNGRRRRRGKSQREREGCLCNKNKYSSFSLFFFRRKYIYNILITIGRSRGPFFFFLPPLFLLWECLLLLHFLSDGSLFFFVLSLLLLSTL